MSGGVDSGVALLLEKEKYGRDALGVTLILTEPTDEQAVSDARAVCERMNTRHTCIHAEEEFRRAVIDYFAEEYLAGRTPNPCVVCNREIKFGLLAKYADEHGCDSIVTGHYARLEQIGGYTFLRRAVDSAKDQTYMLARLAQNELRRAHFPLGELTKAEVRAIAEEHGLVNAHKHDSQDVCFVPDGDYVSAIEKITGRQPIGGDYIDTDGKILGSHRGYWCYTIGQRKGLGIALGKHAFVLDKNAQTNTVTLGDEGGLFKKSVAVEGLVLPSDPNALDGDTPCMAKIRYAHKAAKAVFHRTEEMTGVLEFEEEQRAPSPGQFAVMYDESGEYVLGSAVII